MSLIEVYGMRAVIQRCTSASVCVEGRECAAIGAGLLVLVGIEDRDGIEDVQYLARKIAALRIFDDESGVMNRSLIEAGGGLILVSQFTLMASTKKGNRPSYIRASRPEHAVPLYEELGRALEALLGREIGRGVFGADMQVSLVNSGPVTILIDSQDRDF